MGASSQGRLSEGVPPSPRFFLDTLGGDDLDASGPARTSGRPGRGPDARGDGRFPLLPRPPLRGRANAGGGARPPPGRRLREQYPHPALPHRADSRSRAHPYAARGPEALHPPRRGRAARPGAGAPLQVGPVAAGLVLAGGHPCRARFGARQGGGGVRGGGAQHPRAHRSHRRFHEAPAD